MRKRDDVIQQMLIDYQRVMRERLGVEDGIAQRVAKELLQVFQKRFGGEELYVPRAKRYDEAAVLRDFNGSNAQEVMKKHSVPERSFYRLLERHRQGVPPRQPEKAASSAPSVRRRNEPPFSW